MARRSAMSGDDITVHVDWLARRLTQQQEDAAATEQHRIMVTAHRVARVPGHLRLAKRDAYTPGLVAIGPLHAADSERRLRAGYRLKMSYLHSLVSRGHADPTTHLGVIQGYVRLVAAREREARAMYAAEDVDGLSAEDFVQMLVLDGCFVIEHLVNVTVGLEEPALHGTPFGPAQLAVDLVLAENQIPFFVLVDLMKSTRLPGFDTTGYDDPPVLLMKLALYYLAGEKGRDMTSGLPSADGVSHILHLLHATVTAARTRWLPPPRVVQDGALVETAQDAARLLRRLPLLLLVPLLYPILPEERRWSASYGREDLPSATDLKRMWVRFKRARGGNKAATAAGSNIASVLGPVPLAVNLEHEECLRLPRLRIEFRTAPLLLNLIAFEQSSSSAEQQRAGDVSAYAWLMAKMVQSPEDAGVLVAAEVVQSATAGSESKEDVARFFREVGAASEAAEQMEKSYLGETLVKLRERSRHPLFMMWADVQRNYFTVPWAVVAEVVAFITFISTILQTYGSFKH